MARKKLTVGDLFAHPLHLPALGFGAGLSPWAPGTIGTLAGVPIYALLANWLNDAVVWAVLLMTISGAAICGIAARNLGVHDHGGIVWDEIVGYGITMLWLPLEWQWLVAGFVLFRFFDIIKPWPIRWLDRHVEGGTGIMLDDIVAALMAGAALHLANILF